MNQDKRELNMFMYVLNASMIIFLIEVVVNSVKNESFGIFLFLTCLLMYNLFYINGKRLPLDKIDGFLYKWICGLTIAWWKIKGRLKSKRNQDKGHCSGVPY